MQTPLLKDITEFLAETGMGEFRFGLLAVSNGRLIEQLRKTRKNGQPGRVWPETETKIRAFMLAERQRRKAERAA
jgi:hypothetical protein